MKNLIFTLTMILFLGACASIEKLVEKGEYDRAIALAAKKLQGKKNKKTKYVKGLEKAFQKITKRDMDHVSNLVERDNPKYWDEIFETYRAIDKRQAIIEPLLPLVSKDGYRAKFKFVKTSGLKKEAADNAAKYYYDRALMYMDDARENDKLAAKNAYESLDRIQKYKDNYKNTHRLMDEAYELGQTRILVAMKNRSANILPARFERELFSFGIRNLDTRWYKFYTESDHGNNFDITATYYIEFIEVSPEREIVNHEFETKEIADGWQYVLDNNGNVLKDSLGNDVKVDKFKTISAEVAHVIMEKNLGMDGHLKVLDLDRNKIILNKMISGEAVFDEHFSTFKGDKKALSKKTKNRLKHVPVYFPSNEDMLLMTANEIKDELKRNLRNLFR